MFCAGSQQRLRVTVGLTVFDTVTFDPVLELVCQQFGQTPMPTTCEDDDIAGAEPQVAGGPRIKSAISHGERRSSVALLDRAGTRGNLVSYFPLWSSLRRSSKLTITLATSARHGWTTAVVVVDRPAVTELDYAVRE